MKLSICALCAFLLSFLFTSNAFPQESLSRPDGRAIEGKIDGVLRARGGSEAAACYRDLFVAAGVNGLSELKRSPHDSIAIQAAWEEVARTVPDTGIDLRPDGGKLNWFVGFFEGRTRARVPKWWSNAILDARANTRYNIYFPEENWDQALAQAIAQTTLTKKGDKYSLQVGKHSIDLPNGLSKDIPVDLLNFIAERGKSSSAVRLTACFTSNNCYLALYNELGYAVKLACVERSTTKVLWTARGWGSAIGSVTGVPGRALVTVDAQGDRVLVFGSDCAGCLYAAAVRADNGKNLFRFSNAYSGFPPLPVKEK
jgi:hypothetical protein